MNWTCFLHRDGLEDPLDDAGLVQQQLDQLSTIGRCEYEKTCALLVQLFDQAAQTYQELLQSTNSNTVDVTVQEGTLSSHSCCTNFISTIWSSAFMSVSTRCRAVSTSFTSLTSFFLTGRLTWLVYIIGAVIGGRVSFASTDEQDAMDGELVCR